MSVLTIAGIVAAVLGAGGIGAIVMHLVAGYRSRLAHDVELAKVADKRESREDQITRETALEDREDRRRMEIEVRELRETVTRLSVDVARCEERHTVSEERERELTTRLDLSGQLIERYRAELASVRAEFAALSDRFDSVVKAAMTRDSVPPGVPAE